MAIINTNPSKVTNESSSKNYSKKRKQEPQIQNSVFSGIEKVPISPRKRKGSSVPVASTAVTPESMGDFGLSIPLSVKISAVETLEILLNVVCLNFCCFNPCSHIGLGTSIEKNVLQSSLKLTFLP